VNGSLDIVHPIAEILMDTAKLQNLEVCIIFLYTMALHYYLIFLNQGRS